MERYDGKKPGNLCLSPIQGPPARGCKRFRQSLPPDEVSPQSQETGDPFDLPEVGPSGSGFVVSRLPIECESFVTVE